MRKARFLILLITAVLISATVYFQLKPAQNFKKVTWYQWDDPLDTLGHLLGYLVLAILYALLVFKTLPKSFTQYLIVLSPVIALGIVLELLQTLLPTRNFNIYDLAANLIGVGIAYPLALWLYQSSAST